MSGMACGAGMSMSMNMGDDDDLAVNHNNNTIGAMSSKQAAAEQQAHARHRLLQKNAAATMRTRSSDSTSTGNHTTSTDPATIRQSRSSGSASLYKPTKHHHNSMTTGGSQDFDNDHHTFATATTASATISYSTDEVDHIHSDVSEAGMEVVMDHTNNSSIDPERLREQQILSLMNNTKQKQALLKKTLKEVPYTSHSFPAGKNTFTVDTRYSFLRVIGSGAYGVVISAKDEQAQANAGSNAEIAIKMVPRAFHDEIDAKRILREIKLLKHFQHENIVALVDMMPPGCQYVEDYNDVYMVTDLMETDLHRIIYSKQKLSMDHVQYFVYQVLRGLKYIHSCNVLHRDLKPSNLLVNSNCDLKICDFGLARGIYGDDDADLLDEDATNEAPPRKTLMLTEYVVTRWYRAPEIMLACHEYSKPIDVWSVGCIFAELMLRKPYFPGDDYIDQVRTVCHKSNILFCCDIVIWVVFGDNLMLFCPFPILFLSPFLS